MAEGEQLEMAPILARKPDDDHRPRSRLGHSESGFAGQLPAIETSPLPTGFLHSELGNFDSNITTSTTAAAAAAAAAATTPPVMTTPMPKAAVTNGHKTPAGSESGSSSSESRAAATTAVPQEGPDIMTTSATVNANPVAAESPREYGARQGLPPPPLPPPLRSQLHERRQQQRSSDTHTAESSSPATDEVHPSSKLVGAGHVRPQFLARPSEASQRVPLLHRSSRLSQDLLSPQPQLQQLQHQQQRRSDEDEDEDIPLGILAAHGFPSKNRPPAQLPKMASSTNLGPAASASTSTLVPPPALAADMPSSSSFAASTASGESSIRGNEARHSTLPVFARSLPQDPYNAMGPVKPYDMGGPPSLQRNSIAASSSVTDLPRGGLVGVIAGEERARAMRRGGHYDAYGGNNSPFTGGYSGVGSNAVGPLLPRSSSPFLPQFRNNNTNSMMMMSSNGWMQPPPSAANANAAAAAQAQMSQQMTEMMWMQMMWMQQMMQMQGMQNGFAPMASPLQQQQQQQQAQFMPPVAQPQPVINVVPTTGLGSRPASVRGSAMTGSATPADAAAAAQLHQRTMSLLDPAMSLSNRSSVPATARFSQYGPQPAPMAAQFAPSFAPAFAPAFAPPVLPELGYAASIAPSERSTVGLPPRYRPVSAGAGSASASASASAAASTVGPAPAVVAAVPAENRGGEHIAATPTPKPSALRVSATSTGTSNGNSASGGLLSALSGLRLSSGTPKKLAANGCEDDDDDAAWEELKRKREKTKMSWRFKKASSGSAKVGRGS